MFLIHLTAVSQAVRIQGGFAEDSMEIGQEIHFWITASYPPDMELVFPDSLHDFLPYEFLSKTFTPSQLLGDLAYDSASYALQSFEIDPIQYLQLPAYVLAGPDTTVYFTQIDSIHFSDLVEVASDTTQLKQNLSYFNVSRQFNQPLMWVILGALVVVLVLLYVFFGIGCVER